MNTAAFRITGLSHVYPDRTAALRDVSAEIPAGETVAILGPSGSGKSTLLSILGLLWDETGPTGQVIFHDGKSEHALLRMDADARADLRAAAFGFVLQSSYLLPHFSCRDNVAMPLALHGWPAAARRKWVERLLTAAGIDPRGDLVKNERRPPRKVSLGQRQRYAVLRAIITDPLVVFADEPSSNLDPGSTAAMFDLLAAWKAGSLFNGSRDAFLNDRTTPGAVREWFTTRSAHHPPRTLILVCHDVQIARRHANRFLLLNKNHSLEISFTRESWNEHAEFLETILGLPSGAAGRDST